METKKSMVLLFCFDKLFTEHRLYKKTIKEQFKVSKAAFDRYKKDIRIYLEIYRPEMKLKYSKSVDAYYLSSKTRK